MKTGKKKDSSNNDEIIHDDSPFVNNNNSPFRNPKIVKLKKYTVFMNDFLNETMKSKSTGEKINYPNTFDLIKRSKFGKPDLNHSFTSRKVIEHIILFNFESRYLTKREIASLLLSNLIFEIFHNMLLWSKYKYFNSLLINEERHVNQKELDNERVNI